MEPSGQYIHTDGQSEGQYHSQHSPTGHPLSPIAPPALLCPYCRLPFVDPRILECNHSFCERDLIPLVKDGGVVCPLCRHQTQLDVHSTLRRDDLLLFLLESQDSTEGTQCENCEKNSAEHFCGTCIALLCEECREATHSAKLFARHEMAPASSRNGAMAASVRCPLHDRPIELFCLEDSQLLCVGCFLDGDHREHQGRCVDLDAAHRIAQERLSRSIETVADLAEAVRNAIVSLRRLKSETEDNMRRSHSQVDRLCDELMARIRACKESLLSDVKGQRDRKSAAFDSQLMQLESLLPKIELALAACEHVTHVTNATHAIHAQTNGNQASDAGRRRTESMRSLSLSMHDDDGDRRLSLGGLNSATAATTPVRRPRLLEIYRPLIERLDGVCGLSCGLIPSESSKIVCDATEEFGKALSPVIALVDGDASLPSGVSSASRFDGLHGHGSHTHTHVHPHTQNHNHAAQSIGGDAGAGQKAIGRQSTSHIESVAVGRIVASEFGYDGMSQIENVLQNHIASVQQQQHGKHSSGHAHTTHSPMRTQKSSGQLVGASGSPVTMSSPPASSSHHSVGGASTTSPQASDGRGASAQSPQSRKKSAVAMASDGAERRASEPSPSSNVHKANMASKDRRKSSEAVTATRDMGASALCVELGDGLSQRENMSVVSASASSACEITHGMREPISHFVVDEASDSVTHGTAQGPDASARHGGHAVMHGGDGSAHAHTHLQHQHQHQQSQQHMHSNGGSGKAQGPAWIGDYSHISPGSSLNGNSSMGLLNGSGGGMGLLNGSGGTGSIPHGSMRRRVNSTSLDPIGAGLGLESVFAEHVGQFGAFMDRTQTRIVSLRATVQELHRDITKRKCQPRAAQILEAVGECRSLESEIEMQSSASKRLFPVFQDMWSARLAALANEQQQVCMRADPCSARRNFDRFADDCFVCICLCACECV
eukprot:Opistho-2@8348